MRVGLGGREREREMLRQRNRWGQTERGPAVHLPSSLAGGMRGWGVCRGMRRNKGNSFFLPAPPASQQVLSAPGLGPGQHPFNSFALLTEDCSAWSGPEGHWSCLDGGMEGPPPDIAGLTRTCWAGPLGLFGGPHTPEWWLCRMEPTPRGGCS